jgi:hypothetical protein
MLYYFLVVKQYIRHRDLEPPAANAYNGDWYTCKKKQIYN